MRATLAKYLIVTLFLVTGAAAQDVDLNTIPDNFGFTSRGQNGNATITYLGRDGALFQFRSDRDASQGNPEVLLIWTNSASQAIRIEWEDGEVAKYAPHGCGPALGDCNFVVRHSSGTVSKRARVTFMIGDVWVDRTYFIIDGQRVFQSQSCTTFDDYGFWIDYVREAADGTLTFGERVASSIDVGETTPFEDLQDMCRDAREMVS